MPSECCRTVCLYLAILESSLVTASKSSSAWAQDLTVREKVEALLEHYECHDQFMGAVTITKNGERLVNKAVGFYGYQDGDRLMATPQTKYRIGSVTKTFTATLISQLIDEEKLKIEDKLAQFFPDVKNADKITIDHLLHHQTGIANITNSWSYVTWRSSPQSREAMLKRIDGLSSKFDPGEKSQYSNTNYLLLGYIIEEITGKSYADVLQERIAKPLGLKNTYYGKKPVASDNEARAYRHLIAWIPVSETDMSVPHGAGAIVSTTEDVARFIEALLEGKLVSEESLEQMKDVSSGKGQGLMQLSFGEREAFGHNGSIDGFLTNAAYFPKEKIAVAVCGNGIVAPFNDLLIDILKCTFGKAPTLPEFGKAD